MKYYSTQDINILISQIEKWSELALMKCGLARSINTRQVNKDEVQIWTNLEYALVREYGRKPWKFPPPQALVWRAARKGMINWWVTSRYEDLEAKDKGTIYVIARAIAQNWTPWKHTFENVMEREKENVGNLFQSYMNWW